MCSAKIAPRWPRARDIFVVLFLSAVGAGAVSGCGNTDERPNTWPFISTAIIEPSCATANCHSALVQRAGVDLSTRQVGYATLTTRQFVITDKEVSDPDQRVDRSEIVHLMRADGTLRMPPDSPLPEADIQLIVSWIHDNGAKEN